MLKGIETVRSRGLKPAEAADRIQKLIDRFMPDPHVARTADEERLTHEEWKRRDEVSHHILRLAYCQTQDKRRWFVMHEQALFRCVVLPVLSRLAPRSVALTPPWCGSHPPPPRLLLQAPLLQGAVVAGSD